MFGYENARPRHKTDAVPDIHTVDILSTSSSLLSTHGKRHIDQPKQRAYEKLRRSEVGVDCLWLSDGVFRKSNYSLTFISLLYNHIHCWSPLMLNSVVLNIVK